MRPRLVALATLVLASAAPVPSRAACTVEPQGFGRVGSVVDGRTLRLADGREVRLTGLAYPVGPHAALALAALAGDREVALRGQDDAPDRYGRQSVFVFAEGAETSVQAALLAGGEAVYSGLVADPGCAAELGQAEAAARAARRGLWADRDAIKNAERPGDILALTGQFAVVEGKVVSVRQAGPTFYVNFGRRWTEGFAVTISGRMMGAFEAAGLSARTLENRWVRVRGWVERHGGPRIDLFRTGQIELIAGR